MGTSKIGASAESINRKNENKNFGNIAGGSPDDIRGRGLHCNQHQPQCGTFQCGRYRGCSLQAAIHTGFVCGVELWSFLENGATISNSPLLAWLGRIVKRRVDEEVQGE